MQARHRASFRLGDKLDTRDGEEGFEPLVVEEPVGIDQKATTKNKCDGMCNENENDVGKEARGPRTLWAAARERKRLFLMERPYRAVFID